MVLYDIQKNINKKEDKILFKFSFIEGYSIKIVDKTGYCKQLENGCYGIHVTEYDIKEVLKYFKENNYKEFEGNYLFEGFNYDL